MQTDTLSLTFAALAHPARRAMLARLGQGQATVQELSAPLRLSGPAVTKHLKVLERSGLITRTRDAQWRPCQLDTTPMVEAGDWIAELRAQTELRLDRLESYLAQIQAPPQSNPPGEPQ